jgi:hypothetical protein
MRTQLFWDVTLCRGVGCSQCFAETSNDFRKHTLFDCATFEYKDNLFECHFVRHSSQIDCPEITAGLAPWYAREEPPEPWHGLIINVVFSKFLHISGLGKITTDAHILAHVYIPCPDDRYPPLKMYLSKLILDSYEHVPVAYVTMHYIILTKLNWPRH